MFRIKLKSLHSFFIMIVAIVIASISIITPYAQDTTGGAPIEMTGKVTGINGQIIIVEGLNVDISNTNLVIADIQVDTTVTISGQLQQGVIVASTVVIVTNLPVATATPEMEATEEPNSEATQEPTSDDAIDPLIVIEGPVQAINVNVITIFDIDIKVKDNDPILSEIVVGDVIRIEGTTNFEGNTIIIVAVNITIMNVVVIQQGTYVNVTYNIPAGCKVSKKGNIKCSNKKPKKSKKK